jgi:hypothetical protein
VSGLLGSPGIDRIAIVLGVVVMFWVLWRFIRRGD